MTYAHDRPERLDLEVKRAGKLSEDEVDRVVRVMVEAFNGDFFGQHLVGGDLSLTPLQLRSLIAAANVGGTIILGTTKNRNGQDEIVGALIAFGPGQDLNSTEEQRVAGWYPFIEKADEYTRKWWNEYWNPLAERTCNAAFGEGGTLRAWDIQLLGVRPVHQGKGVASAIMRHVIAMADADNAPMVLGTQNEKNVAMYGKMGFEVKDVINVESRAGTSQFWFMGRSF